MVSSALDTKQKTTLSGDESRCNRNLQFDHNNLDHPLSTVTCKMICLSRVNSNLYFLKPETAEHGFTFALYYAL